MAVLDVNNDVTRETPETVFILCVGSTAFVGLNLFQSALTNWCPAMYFLRKAGVKDAG